MISEAILKNLISPETEAAKIMSDPVVAADGYTYERDFIENWLKTNNTSPRTKALLAHKGLYKNLLVKELIKQYLKFFPDLYSKPGVFVSSNMIKQLLDFINNLDDVGLEKFLKEVEPHLLNAKLTVYPYNTVGEYLTQLAHFAAVQRALNQGENPTFKEDSKINCEEKIKKITQLIADKVKESLIFLEKGNTQKAEEVKISFEILLCSISHELMLEPTIVPDGQTFDKQSIENWLLHNSINPSTKNPLQSNQLINNQLAFDIITTLLLEDQIPEEEVAVFLDIKIDFLKHALTRNSFGRVKWLIEKLNCDFGEKIDGKQTLLHLLCSYKYDLTEEHKLWLQKKLEKAKVDVTDNDGDSPLHLAAKVHQMDWIQLLLHAGANAKLKNNMGLMPLEIEGLGFNLMEENFKLGYLEIIDEAKQQTLLHFVCSEKFYLNPHKELFPKKLVGLKIDTLNKEGNSPLHLAIHNKKILFVTALVNAGANVNLPNATGKLPLQIALEKKDEAIIEQLLLAKDLDLTGKNGEAILATAATVNNEQVFYQLVLQGANPFVVNEQGIGGLTFNVLSKTVQQQIIEVVNQFKNELKIAIEKGDVNLIRQCVAGKPYLLDQPLDDKNNLALHLAAKSGHWNVFKLVYNTHMTKYNGEGQTPLHLVIKEKWGMEFIKELVSLGQDINIVNANGESILMVALLSQQREMINYLLTETMININLPNISKETALHLAIQRGDTELIKILIFKGANVYYQRDETTETLLAEQRWNNHKIFEVMDEAVELISQDYISAVMKDEKSKTQEMEKTYAYLLDQRCSYVKRKLKKLLRNSIGEKDNETIKKLVKKFPFMVNESIAAFGIKPLHFAVTCNNLELARFLLEQGADVNAMSKGKVRNGSTPFHDALVTGNYDLVELLMKFSPDLSLTYNNLTRDDSTNDYPIHLAVKSKDPFIARLLLQAQGAVSVDQVNSQHQTALHLAVLSEDELMIIPVLAYSPDVRLAMNQRGDTVFHYIAERGNLAVLEQLYQYAEPLEIYQDVVNYTNSDGNTPLHLAVAAGHLKVVKFLLEKNATISFNKNGQTPFNLVIAKQDRQFICDLLNLVSTSTVARDQTIKHLLDLAVAANDFKTIEILIIHGANPLPILGVIGNNSDLYRAIINLVSTIKNDFVTAIDGNDFQKVEQLVAKYPYLLVLQFGNALDNPLHLAAKRGSFELFKLFQQLLVDVNAFNADGHKPLYYAAVHADLLRIFSQTNTVDLTKSIDKHGNTLWHLAAVTANLELAKTLREIKLTPRLFDALGDTPLHSAVKSFADNITIIEFLLDNKIITVDQVNEQGLTGLDLAVAKNNLNLIELFLQQGAVPGIVAFRQVVGLKNNNILALFEKYGVGIDAINKAGDIPLHGAIKNKEIEFIENLIQCGADLGIKDATGKNAFLLAVENHLPLEIITLTLPKVKTLSEQKLIINVADKCGFTALHFAVYSALKQKEKIDTEIIKLLLSKGANLNQKNLFGKSVIDIIEDKEQLANCVENKKIIRKIFDEHRSALTKRLQTSVLANDHNATLDLIQQYDLLACFLEIPWPARAQEDRQKFISNLKMHLQDTQRLILIEWSLKNDDYQILKIFLEENKKVTLNNLLADYDIREYLLEIYTFFKGSKTLSAYAPNHFKPNLQSPLLEWAEKNISKILQTGNPTFKDRLSLSQELYHNIVVLAHSVAMYDPKDKMAAEVVLMYKRHTKFLDSSKNNADQHATSANTQPK